MIPLASLNKAGDRVLCHSSVCGGVLAHVQEDERGNRWVTFGPEWVRDHETDVWRFGNRVVRYQRREDALRNLAVPELAEIGYTVGQNRVARYQRRSPVDGAHKTPGITGRRVVRLPVLAKCPKCEIPPQKLDGVALRVSSLLAPALVSCICGVTIRATHRAPCPRCGHVFRESPGEIVP